MNINRNNILRSAYILTIFFIFSCTISRIHAEEYQKNFEEDKMEFIKKYGDMPIFTFVFSYSGEIEKTKRQILMECLTAADGDLLSSFNSAIAVQRIFRMGIISDISIIFERVRIENSDKVLITIHVKEKNTFLLIPVYYASNDSYMAGVLGMESNLLGFNKKLRLEESI